VDEIAKGDHTIFVGEVIEAGLRDENDQSVLMRDHKFNYGG
jgi:flavin reductase (DIM6/NTAB) family NADH-FMN oxidoreductase RutF